MSILTPEQIAEIEAWVQKETNGYKGHPSHDDIPNLIETLRAKEAEAAVLKDALEKAGLALNACNNCLTTDRPDLVSMPEDFSWTINNSKEIRLIYEALGNKTACLHSIDPQGYGGDAP